MTEHLTNDTSKELPSPITEEYLLGLHSTLGREKGSKIYYRDCPSPEHVAGYYIEAYGGLDEAIQGLRVALSGQFTDQVPNRGDEQVLEILKIAETHQTEVVD